MKKSVRFSLILSIFLTSFLSHVAFSQTTGDYQSNAASFNWTATANWQRWNGSAWVSNPAEGYPGQNASGIAGTVTILNTHTVTLNVNPAQSIGNLILASGSTFAGGNNTLTLSGNFTNNGGTFTVATSTITFNGTGAQAINGTVASQSFNNIIVNKASGALSVGGSITTVSVASFTQTLGDFNAPATLNITSAFTLTAGNFSAGSNLNINGGNFANNGGTFVPNTGSVTFTSGAAQAINGTAVTQTFNNLVINKSGNTLTVGGSTTTLNVNNLTRTLGNFTAPATLNVSGTITLTAGTFTAGTNTNLSGDFINDGGTFTPGANTVTFNGSGAQTISGAVATQTFGNVIINKAGGAVSVGGSTTTVNVAAFTQTLGDFNAPATLAATGAVTLTAGTFTAGANLNISGASFTNNGATFVPGAGAVTFTGGAAQQINGTPATQTFNNLVINKSANTLSVGGSTTTLNVNNLTRTLGTFAAPATVSVSGSLTLTAGTYTAGATTNVAGSIINTAGTFTAGANTNVGGDFTNNGGTFTPGGNTVTFNGTGAQAINGTAVTQTFSAIIINKTSGAVTVGGSLTTINATTFTQTLGDFSGPATLSVSAGITLTAGTHTAGAAINITGGNFTNNNGATFVPGSNTLTFSSGAAQAINGTLVAQTLGNIIVNKGGGSTLSVGGGTTTLNTAAFTLTAGNFTAPTTFYATGAFTLTAGTFTASTNTNLDGDFINNGGTFSPGTFTVTFGGSGTKTITGSNATIASFYDLVISSGTVVYGSSAVNRTINVLDNLTITGGSFLSGTTVGNAHIINLTGSLQNDGTIDFSANSATAHRIVFTGAGAKTISGAGSTTFQNIVMSTTASAVVNVNANTRINGTLSWTADGLLILGANDITFGNTASATSPTANRYIQVNGTSTSTSQVVKVSNATTASWQFLFPIGTATNGYTPLDLTTATITNAPTINSRLAAKVILGVDEPGKLKRTFRLKVTGNGISTTFTNGRFNYQSPGDVSGAEPIASYSSFWYQKESTGIWVKVNGTAPGTINTSPTLSFFTGPTTSQPLSNDTYYFTIGTPGAYGQTWYSYQTGDWSNPLTWTTDGSSFPLYVNPTNSIPGLADNVIIKSGNTVTMDINNVTINSINVIGTLDLVATTGHNFTTINGSGKIKIAGATDNFPAGTSTNFIDNAVGGTLEINGSGIQLATPRTFNNMIVNMTGATDAAVLKSNFTLNGDFTITNGLFQFENVTAPAIRTFTVNGNVTISSTGGIRTANANLRHEFNLFGDFTNNGTAYFTNRVVADYTGAEATDGIVDVNMRSASKDQAITCNGVTRFYRLEINKGTDDTYKATITAADPTFFNLFGKADYDTNTNQAATNDNALGLIFGTVEIGPNVTIAALNTGTVNYSVYQGSQLWVNGGSVSKIGDASANGAIVPYGKVRVTLGSLTADCGSGLTIRESGSVQVEGGTLTSRCIRTSVLGTSAVGSYIQSGGTVNLTGITTGGIQTGYAELSLTYTGNVFNMSGGTLTIRGVHNTADRAAIFINSDPANVSVTGGTVIFEISNNNAYRITSRAPFWNVILRKTAGTTTAIQLAGTTSGTGTFPDLQTLLIQPLVVLNDLTIESPVTFNTNNADVTVGGDFEIKNGATYTFGTNTTTINGSGVSSLVFGNTATTQSFNNLVINKTNTTDEVAVTSGRPSPSAALQVNGTLTVSKGTFNYGSFNVSTKSTVTLGSSVTVGKLASTGKLVMDGASAQTLNSSLASIYNVEINNSSNVTLATNNLTILQTLTLTAGNFNIGILKLTLSGSTATIAGSSFSATKMIQTAANASDGGLELYLDANETLTFPIGVAGKYTPVTATFTSFSDDGLVKINPVNGVLQTTNLSGGADILAYYWRVGSSNFTVKPTVRYTFQYVIGDVGGVEANYFPGKVLDSNPFTRSSETPSTKVNTTTKVITFNGSGTGFTLEDANYTAGGTNRFTGLPIVYYTRVFGDGNNIAWTNANNWTLGTNGAFAKHDSRQSAAPDYPKAGDIAIVGYVPFTDVLAAANLGKPHGIAINNGQTIDIAELRFEQMKDVSNNPTARNYAFNFQFRPTVVINNYGTQGQLTNAKVSGEGMFWIRTSAGNPLSDPSFTGVDLGSFNLQDSSYVVYENANNGSIYNNMPTSFPNLMMASNGWGNQDQDTTIPKNITVNGDFELLGNINLVLSTGATGDITVKRKFRFFRSNANGNDSGGGGELRFGNTGTPRTINILGDLLIGNGYAAIIRVLTPGTTPITHTINLYGNFTQRTTAGNGFKGGAVATEDRINMNLLGSSSMTLTNSGGDAPQFYSLTVNKGTSIATTASFNSLFTIDGPTNAVAKPLTLTNGLFIINAAANIVLTSGGADFNIPATAGLEVKAGTVATTTTSTNANITLDGLLRVSGGTVTVDGGGATDTNYIQYSNSGNAAIEVTGGTLTVAGQIRRDLTSTTGILKYTQSAGTVLVANEGTSTAIRGVFEVINPGSQFNHSGGSFTIVRGNGSASVPSLWLEPGSTSITAGSTITIGNASTPAGTIGIKSLATLNNLNIAGLAASTPQVSLYVTPLTVAGDITVAASNTLNALSRDLTIGGNFTVNGTYTSGNNTTTFNNPSTATIGGVVSALSFYNFTKSGVGTLTLARDITVNRDLKSNAGVLATATFTINLLRHAEINATITSTSGSGLIFGSTTTQQQLTRASSGTGTMGIVTINNSNGVIIPDGNGYDFNITTNLRLQSGVFDIGGSLLSLGTAAVITPVNPFSAANLIQTNSSFTDKGVRKQFPTNYTTDFVFPVGQAYYTPITFNFSSGNTTGSSGTPTITVRPSNRVHPVIVNDDGVGEQPDPVTFNDLNNALQYYWIISATGVSNTFKSSMALQYTQPLVAAASPYYSESDYIAARILTDPSVNPSLNITKLSTAEVNEGTNTITFNFSSVVDERSISGEYFAGVDVAIPNNVPTYTTVMSGNVGDNIYDSPVFGGIPTGSRVIVSPGHTVTFNTGSVILYQTVINSGATVIIPSGSIGHSLGTLSGTGDLEIDSDDVSAVLPAAIYDTFFSCAGGGLIFGGSGSYEILGGITTLRNLTLNGTGDKSLSNNNITICNDLTINNGGFFNSSSRTIIVQNDVLLNAGSFSTSAGTLTITRDLTQTSGAFDGGTGGTKTIGRNLTINGGSFTPGSGSANIIRVNGNMTVSNAATISTGTGGATGQRFTFGGTVAQVLTGDFTSSRAFNRLEISNSAGLTFAGDVTLISQLILTNGLITPGSNRFLLTSTATASPTAGSATSFVNGKLYKTVASGGSGFTFPIGKSSRWRSGAVLSVSSNGVTWDMEYFSGTSTGAVAAAPPPRSNPVNNLTSSDPLVLRLSNAEYWKVSDGSATSNGRSARVGLSWGIESDVSANLAQREAMKVMSWNGTNWTNNGGTNFQPGGAHTQTRGTFESTATLSFSENIVTLGSTEIANALPVNLIKFEGSILGSIASLYWETASELNNEYFELQHSLDGSEFIPVGRREGKGTTNQKSEYYFEHRNLTKGVNYYRLLQSDFDGKVSYSDVISLEYDGATPLIAFLFPNPTTHQNINIELVNATSQNVNVRIFDMTGKTILTSVINSEDLESIISLKSSELKSGVYIVEVVQGSQRITKRLVIRN
ncbi:MAG: T9SS type A sorting domain-containing protein [Bacteroidetes bacterium]|nr:T9SS type A sorting domain-containing protein [Bacteroidota bacterium]